MGQTADDGGDGEQRETTGEDSLWAYQVAQPTGEQQQPAERDEVGIDHPGQVQL